MSGNPNPTTCGRCGTRNPPRQTVCASCGASLVAPDSTDTALPLEGMEGRTMPETTDAVDRADPVDIRSRPGEELVTPKPPGG